jgi:hypothetical protein
MSKQTHQTKTFQPQPRLLTETYQPVGQVQVPTTFVPLVSGVAPPPPPPQPATANGQSK